MDFFYKYKEDMERYIKDMLCSNDSSGNQRKSQMGYSRFEHIIRVYKWMEILYEAYPMKDAVDLEVLSIATLFHDIGYCHKDTHKHGEIGAQYCRSYLLEREYPAENTEFICDLISRHSDKESMFDDIPHELILLMEADLLDDTGAQGLVMDVWLEVICQEKATFESVLEHMENYTHRIMKKNPMRTEEGIKIWNEKRRLAEDFIESYRRDLHVESIKN